MKIQEIINRIKKDKAGIMSIWIPDASNATGRMMLNGTRYTNKYVNRQKGDEVIVTGYKETNITEIERTLTSLIGNGRVNVHLENGKWLEGEIEA